VSGRVDQMKGKKEKEFPGVLSQQKKEHGALARKDQHVWSKRKEGGEGRTTPTFRSSSMPRAKG